MVFIRLPPLVIAIKLTARSSPLCPLGKQEKGAFLLNLMAVALFECNLLFQRRELNNYVLGFFILLQASVVKRTDLIIIWRFYV
jgi:hypothetical protein